MCLNTFFILFIGLVVSRIVSYETSKQLYNCFALIWGVNFLLALKYLLPYISAAKNRNLSNLETYQQNYVKVFMNCDVIHLPSFGKQSSPSRILWKLDARKFVYMETSLFVKNNISCEGIVCKIYRWQARRFSHVVVYNS